MIIHLHCFAWHDADRLPHLVTLCASQVDHIHLWALQAETEAFDATLTALPNVTLHRYQAESDSVIDAQRTRFNSAWTLSRGVADWVLMLHADEELHHPDLLGHLHRLQQDGVTAVRAIGYDMVGDDAPADCDQSRPFGEQVTQGCRAPALDRLVMFSPSALTATNYSPGQHHAWPEGNVVWPSNSEVLLLRFQLMGAAHFLSLCARRATDLLPDDRAHRWAAHLDWSEVDLAAHYTELRARARTVPGLGALSSVPPQDYRRSERLIEQAGVFDADWYEATYPDIAAQQFDALTHYCDYGWREARQPNAWFDPIWYAQRCGADAPKDENPLVHYVAIGERANWSPSSAFDPVAYRAAHGLDEDASALGHFLESRQGLDVGLATSSDHGGAPSPGTAVAVSAPLPQWEPLMAWVASQAADAPADGGIALSAVQDVVREFLPWLPFDEPWYLKTYPDVADAVGEGAFASAHAHFIEHGFFEGRAPSATVAA